ncbi:hypothetical protein ACWD1Z_12310 [Streptomyces sp. NPDC002784]
MIEFDECMHGLPTGPGELLRTREQAFPPATVCEFQHGDVASIGGRGVLGVPLWGSLLVLVGPGGGAAWGVTPEPSAPYR